MQSRNNNNALAPKHKKLRKQQVALLAFCVLFLLCLCIVGCDDDALEDAKLSMMGFKAGVIAFYHLVMTLTLPLAVVSLSVGALYCFGGQKSLEIGVVIIRRTLIAVFCIWILPPVFSEFWAWLHTNDMIWTPDHLVIDPSPT